MMTGLCTACGDVWEEDDRPSVCPECGFTGVIGAPSDDMIALRERHRQQQEDGS